MHAALDCFAELVIGPRGFAPVRWLAMTQAWSWPIRASRIVCVRAVRGDEAGCERPRWTKGDNAKAMSDYSAAKRAVAAPFLHRPFRLLFITRTAANTANQMQAVAVGWLIYDLTGSALALGLIGLVQFLPPLALTLLAGQVIDHHSRRLILNCCYAVEFAVSAGLLVLVATVDHPVRPIFALLFVNAGRARSKRRRCNRSSPRRCRARS
jgi:hypothetical protein